MDILAEAARFTRLVGQPMGRYPIARRMTEAAFLLESSDEGIARIASRVGLSPGRYRCAPTPA